MGTTRRGLLIGGGLGLTAVAAVGGLAEAQVLPGRGALHRALGRCRVAVAEPGAAAGPTVRGSFPSARRRGSVDFMLSYPAGTAPGDPMPVCLVLHGYGASAADAIRAGRYDEHLSALVGGGAAPFALAAMDGGNGYWHPHATDDPLGALWDEFLPLLAGRGLQVGRIGVLGWSMGGYGALLAGIIRPDVVAVVAAVSPAIWRSYDEARRVNPTAFDTAQEWETHNVLARAAMLRGVPVRVDCGADDPFVDAAGALRAALGPAAVHIVRGCHDGRFWQHVAADQLRFVGQALVRARTGS